MTDPARWAELSRWLDALLDLAPEARATLLASIERNDASLADELRALLQADADADARTGLLDAGVAAAAPQLLDDLAAARHDDTTPREPVAGQHVGRWRLQRAIGSGGMGDVFLAERADGEFEQRAALKRLKRGMDSEALLRRFAQERRILAQLDHPRIARLLDAGIDTQDRPYIAMEYVDGLDIVADARERRLDVRARIACVLLVCDAVAHAQSRLVVHRDLKPSNILVDTHGDPHLLDFGIAKILADDDTDAGLGPALTGTGVRVLSPAYAAPEQILGQPIGTATDVYALGVLLFELLTGTLPHRRNVSPDALAVSLQHETVQRPSACLRQQDDATVVRAYGERAGERERFARELQGDLDTIVVTALRHDPARRYSSAAALANELRAWLDGRPIAARPDSRGYRLRKFVGRHRVGVVATGLVLLSLVGGIAAALWQARIAEQHALASERAARKSEETKRFVVSLFEATNPESARKGAQMTALDLLRDASKRVEDGLDEAADTQGELRVTLGQSLFAVGATEDGLALVERGVAQLRALGEQKILANGLHSLSMLYEQIGRGAEAEATAGEALRLLDAMPEPMTRERLGVRTTLAKLLQLHGDTAGALALYRRNLEERRDWLGPDDSGLAVDWNNLGAMALALERDAEARDAYREALRLFDRDSSAPQSRRIWLELGEALALSHTGAFAEAEARLRVTLPKAEASLHAQHPIVASARRILAETLHWRGQHDEAVTQARAALAIHAALNHPDVGISEMVLGQLLLAGREAGDAADAEALRVLTDAERHLGTLRNREDAHWWWAQATLGLALARSGDASGRARIDAALAGFDQRGMTDRMSYAMSVGYAAEAALLGGDTEAARSLADRARALMQQRVASDDPRIAAVLPR